MRPQNRWSPQVDRRQSERLIDELDFSGQRRPGDSAGPALCPL
jgi:hypothetical protein